jgi:predicted dehydrogenase
MTVNLALVGLGYWGPNIARNLASVEGGSLRVLCDSRSEVLDRLARQYPAARAEADYERVLSDVSVDAVVIATPAATHFQLVRAALNAGKHVLVEKPLAMSVAEGEELAALSSTKGVVLMVGHVFIYNPTVRKVKDYIDDGTIGDVLYVYSQRLSLGQVRRDVNALWNFAPHDLSILQYWLGSGPSAALARGFSYVNQGIEDVVFLSLDYPGGVGAHVHISWLDPSKVRRMTIVGSEKMIVYDDVDTDARIMIYDKGVTKSPMPGATVEPVSLGRYETYTEFQLLLRAGDVLIPKVDFVEPLKLECEHFIDCILTGRTPDTDARSGIEVIRALEAAQRSLDSGAVVHLANP